MKNQQAPDKKANNPTKKLAVVGGFVSLLIGSSGCTMLPDHSSVGMNVGVRYDLTTGKFYRTSKEDLERALDRAKARDLLFGHREKEYYFSEGKSVHDYHW